MSAIDELCRLLDKRGVEHEGGERSVRWRDRNGVMMQAFPLANGELGMEVWSCTPAQAIAATLGWGMLTSDDVRDLIERHSDASGGNGRDFHNGAYVAIADELNATLGAGTCHNISKIVDKYGQARFACSECGAWIDSRMLWNPEYRNGESPWVSGCKLNFCPNCGKRIEVSDG